MAPEVEGKSSMYSPIRADRWSCGQVILHLLHELKKGDKTLKSIATKLKVRDPEQRASLLEWDSSSALPVLGGAKGRRAGERKTPRPRQDPIELGGDMRGLNAKKQRLAMSGENE